MKNQKSTFLAIGFVFLGLIACNSDNTTEQTVVIDNPAPTAVANEAPDDYPPLSSIPESTPPPSAALPPPTSLSPAGPFATSSAPINTPVAATSTARLNPAHGQPGHDCAIAVGAPLKSSVAAKPAAAPAIPVATPLETKSVAAPALTSTNLDPNAKINPAHGQPGHDCAVAVGAPLPVK
ncbi:hypothetical protein EGI22_11030 [Lacihabitans sp. LS3-19]|uniref:hypothetical protein n=1 Tax=Lacihabitans sp. LS3-19 TaxID=2487335 RepID=UPI0020CCEBF9|nr:hypothetical protein [Lacihabitans sp. LS3-19]MCP9768448.1 hypothetical protein [Lacihabitans sp. LS3-19]